MVLIRNILLYTTLGVVLLHSHIPHLHHGEMTTIEHDTTHQNANDLVDYLGLAFQHGSADGSTIFILSEQTSTQTIDLDDLQGCGVNNTFTDLISTSKSQNLSTHSQPLFNKTTVSSNGLRAPPAHDYYS
jgi:hypothetical protein